MSGLRYEVPTIQDDPELFDRALEAHALDDAGLVVFVAEQLRVSGAYDIPQDQRPLDSSKDFATDARDISVGTLTQLIAVRQRLGRRQVPVGMTVAEAQIHSDDYLVTALNSLDTVLQPQDGAAVVRPIFLGPEEKTQSMARVLGIELGLVGTHMLANINSRMRPFNTMHTVAASCTLRKLS